MDTPLKSYTQRTPRDLVPAISAPQALEQWVEHNFITVAEADANRTALSQAQEADKNGYTAKVQNALTVYQKQYSSLHRFMLYLRRGFKDYQPNLVPIAASPETQLLEQVVVLQEAIIQGYELFKVLPDIVQKMKNDYGKLAARENELGARIHSLEEELRALPERQREYTALLQRLEEYDALPEQEKKTLSAELQTKTGVDILPPLENAAVRSVTLRKLMPEQQRLTNDNLSSLLEVSNIEYASVQRQQRMIESQERQLEQGWKPALIQLSRLKEQYDMLSRFTSGARLLIGMNQLRKDTTALIAQSEDVMTNAAAYINNTRIEAEAYEDAFSQPTDMRIFPEADTDEAIIIEFEEEPFLVKRK